MFIKKPHSPYQGLDRLSILIASLGTHASDYFSSHSQYECLSDPHDCEAMAAFITRLKEDFEHVLESLHQENP